MARSEMERRFRRLMYSGLLALMIMPVAHAQVPTVYPMIETGMHTATINRIAVDRDSRWLVTASDDKTARVWDLNTGSLERIVRPPIGEGQEGKLYAVAMSPDGSRVALGGFTGRNGSGAFPVYLFDRATGRLVSQSTAFAQVVKDLAFSHDGKRLAAVFGQNGGVRIVDASNPSHELASDQSCVKGGYGADFDDAGRLVTTCDDGFVRLYDARGRRLAERKVEAGSDPMGVMFSPDGSRVAVGFYESTAVVVLSGKDLATLYRPDTRLATKGDLSAVTWSRDGEWLYAAGRFGQGHDNISALLAWPERGRGRPRVSAIDPETIFDLVALNAGRVAFGSATPAWGVLDATGRAERVVRSATVDHRANESKFRVSANGARVEFGFDLWDGENWSRSLARVDIGARTFDTPVTTAEDLRVARTDGLRVTDWDNNSAPKLNGTLIALREYETSYALSIAPDIRGFVLGTNWSLYSFDQTGRQQWRQTTPDVAWAVNHSADGRFVIAALGDGTVRWYDSSSGRERFAFFVHAQDHRWVLFTPEGFYQSSERGDELIGYQLNNGAATEGEFIDSRRLSEMFFRPDLITRRLAREESAIDEAVRSIGDVRTVLAAGLAPNVTLLSPSQAESSGEYELRVRITPAESGGRVGQLKIFINGAEVPTRDASPPGGGEVTQRLSLAPGVQRVSARAMRSDGKVASDEVAAVVTVKPTQDQLPVLRVLAVGVSQYDDATFNAGVKFASRDAQELVDRLRSGATGVYRDVDVTLLNTRANTTLASIDRELRALTGRARPEDVVIIFLAGHGKAPDGQYHFIPAEFIYDSEQAFSRGKTLTQQRLLEVLKGLGAGKRLLILDTCASGTVGETRDGATDHKDAIARLMKSSGRYILAAASPQGKALESGMQGHGVYTYALIEGLAGAADPNNTGMIEADALADYVSRRVPELTQQIAGYAQRPMRSAEGQTFPIVRRAEPR